MKAALLKAIDEVSKELVSVLLPALVEMLGYGSEVLDNGYWFDLAVGGAKYSLTVAMELTHRTEGLCVTCKSQQTSYWLI